MNSLEFQFSLVIDDDLGEELCNFRSNRSYNVHIVEKILHYYKNYPIFTKSDLLKKYYDDSILNAILSNVTTRLNIDNSSVEDIAKHTIYKVVLCNDKSKKDTIPYIYIGGDRIENNFTATFFKNEPRQKALEHLKSLLENANYIFVYDKFITTHWDSFKLFCENVLPKKRLTMHYPSQQNRHFKSNEIKEICTYWTCSIADNRYSNYSYEDTHDRYLIIDGKIEVILTSGIDNLMDDSKDFTYIIRKHK